MLKKTPKKGKRDPAVKLGMGGEGAALLRNKKTTKPPTSTNQPGDKGTGTRIPAWAQQTPIRARGTVADMDIHIYIYIYVSKLATNRLS